MASLDDTSLYQEFSEIAAAGELPVHYYWSCEIHAGGEIVRPYKVLSIDFIRDYDNSYSDNIELQVSIAPGAYAHQVIPFKEDLKVTLKKNPVSEVKAEENFDLDPEAITLQAFLVDDGNPAIEGNHSQTTDPTTADYMGAITVSLQLVDSAIEQLRMKTVGGVFKDAVPGHVLQALMTLSSKNIAVDANSRVRGVDLAEPSNQQPRKHVVIPHGTKLTRLPSYVQEHCGGVYSSGLGHYLQRGIWYVYPEFDHTRFSRTTRTLSIINVAANQFPGLERTFKYEGGKLIVLSTGEVNYHDDSESLQLNYGNGVRFTNASRVLEGFSTTQRNVTRVSRHENNAEYVARARRNGLNNVYFSEDRITSNSFKETSKLARRSGAHLELVWENSDGELIYPGMPVRVLYMYKEEVVEVYGTVLRAQTYISAVGTGPSIHRHKSVTNLVLFIERV